MSIKNTYDFTGNQSSTTGSVLLIYVLVWWGMMVGGRVSDCEWTRNTCRSFSWRETWPRRLWRGQRLLCTWACISRIRPRCRSKSTCPFCPRSRHPGNTCWASGTGTACECSSRSFAALWSCSADANEMFSVGTQRRQLQRYNHDIITPKPAAHITGGGGSTVGLSSLGSFWSICVCIVDAV